MSLEVELKLAIAAADIPRFKRHPALKALLTEKPATRKLTSIYYDTPQLALFERKVSLRVRRMSGAWFQAVKAAGKSLAGLHRRSEWEEPIARGQPDFTKIANISDPALMQVFAAPGLRAALAPMFRTEVQRTEWQLACLDGSHIELALDVGELIAGEHREAISEIELELKSGHPARLFELALELQKTIPLTLENVSKAQRGYAQYRPQPLDAVKAHATELKAGMSAHEALRQIAWECLEQLQGNLNMVLRFNDAEGVHQMRVALRRLRSLFAVFGTIVSRENCADLLAELRWISEPLGRARDLDVFINETLPPMMMPLHQHPGLLQLREKALQAQAEAYDETRATLRSQRTQRLQLVLGAWLESDHWITPETAGTTVREIAHQVLAKRHQQLRKHGKRLLHMHPEERHQTRISAKKLRYAAEFFISLSPAHGAKRFIRALAEVQNALGTLNDIATTEGLIRRLIGDHPNPALDEVLYLVTGWDACNATHNLDYLHEKWDAFASQPPFWR